MRVEKLRQKFDLEIVFRSFPLHPDTPPEGLTLEQLFAGRGIDIPAAQERLSQLITAEGLPYGKRTMTYNSRLAQELAKWAETQPNGDAIHTALFQAYFVNNVNLAQIDNLTLIAEQVGLSKTEAKQTLVERTFRDEVDSDWLRSRELGITGVPTFVLSNRMIVGAQPYEQLEAFVNSAI